MHRSEVTHQYRLAKEMLERDAHKEQKEKGARFERS